MARNSNKKEEKIIEKEPIAIEKEAIVNPEEVKEEDTIEVESPEVIIENSNEEKTEENNDEKELKKSEKVKLKIEIGFNDKYTGVDYKVGDIIPFEEKRAEELLKDSRKLVSKV